MSAKKRCQAIVWHRDAYRYTGRTKGGFELHYTEAQCKRAAKDGSDFCHQHQTALRCKWADAEMKP